MTNPDLPTHADVIIVGAGPTGSALAGDLGQRGISVLLIDQTDGVIHDARLHSVSIRTMELARHWGIDQDLRNCGWPLDHPQDVVWGTSLSDPETARISWPSIADMTPPATSPTFAQRCAQRWFNPILLRFAQNQPSITTLLQWQVGTVDQDSDGVTVHATDPDGTPVEFTGSYLVAADGARSSIRRALGIETVKSSVWGTSAEVIIRSPQLKALPLAQTLGRFTVLEPAGMSISLLPFDGIDQFRVTVMVGDGNITTEDMLAAVRKIAGTDVDVEFKSEILPWSNRETMATRFRDGRIFLAGDAAHTMPTTGGLGMNTGILDSFDLGWKLDAALRGWAGDGLLDSYDPERRVAVAQTAALASSIYQDWVQTKREHEQFWARIETGGPDADLAKSELGKSLVHTFRREFNNIPASLGFWYEGSPICLPDGTSVTDLTFSEYTPTARPGHRAPHVWLADGTSTLDLFGPEFTLLVIGQSAADTAAFEAAAHQRGVPAKVVTITDPAVAAPMLAAYDKPYVLVRPDGHVAWRSDELPADPGVVLDIARGATSPADSVLAGHGSTHQSGS
ncbi:MAG: 2-polyprenyl-6-methoxyphenol hydroxylase [Gordonia sp. (in: high G+C Gram-positive bacteria)]|nr:MAG: 2-polyprenyl-6-methoxyphenol hydroxylase [Gordonia sp. (in: high G+C Gram-positive bacteria)]